MLEYPIDEAAALLEKNLNTAQTSLKEVEEDIGFISDQCTTMEVGILPYHKCTVCANNITNVLLIKWTWKKY